MRIGDKVSLTLGESVIMIIAVVAFSQNYAKRNIYVSPRLLTPNMTGSKGLRMN